ncbi:MAG: hypothetical protein F4122_11230 [Gammaproteobacteria bacterium]|nr:hypothetical protein [Gammaproteobacteria bacterium]MYE28207.1 hypothetical protein [Gammaproteobacteria bacterium]MYI03043.1 hypothetical protein [Gammaproteobacteria bacterium]
MARRATAPRTRLPAMAQGWSGQSRYGGTMIATANRNAFKSLRCGLERGRLPPRAGNSAGGWSLVELLVATALSMSLATLAARAFLAGDALQAEATAELRLESDARYAMHVLTVNARLAGFPGCFGESPEYSPLNSTWVGPMAFIAVEGWDALRPHPELQPVTGSDTVAFQWSIGGCGAGIGEFARELRPPPADAGVAPGRGLRSALFYIGRRGGMEGNPLALFMRESSDFGDADPARELVEGIESMRVRFRLTSNEDFVPAHRVGNWNDVLAVRFELRLQSLQFADLWRDFGRTASLRNRPIVFGDFPPAGTPGP